jgi:hypothetical protein
MLINGALGLIVGGLLVPIVSSASWVISALQASKKREL